MESLITAIQPAPISERKPKRAASKALGSGSVGKHAAPGLPGWSVPELANALTTGDAVSDEGLLSNLERCIAETTFETLEGVVVADADLRTLKVNNSFTRITGYSKREAVGYTSSILSDIREHLLRDRTWNDEVLGRKKSGEPFAAKLRVKAVVDAFDCVTHYIATFNDLSAKKALQKKINHLNFTDTLTGLKNRSAMLMSLQRALDKSREQKNYGAVLLVDIDDFKNHNVRLGHLCGDLILQQSAQRISQVLGPNAAVARLFADKFLIVLEEVGATVDEAGAYTQHVATSVRNIFSQPFGVNAAHVCVSVSLGHCLIGTLNTSVDALIDRAELVTYNAKQAGGDCILSFEFGSMDG